MLDKIIYIDNNNVMLIYTHKNPVMITTDNGTAMDLCNWLLTPKLKVDFATFVNCKKSSLEDTSPNYEVKNAV